MHVKPLGQFRQRLIVSHRGQRHLALSPLGESISFFFTHCLLPFIVQ